MSDTKLVLIRSTESGVHYGTLVSRTGAEVTLKDSRRIYSWTDSYTINEVVTKGVGPGSRISCAIPEITIISCSEIMPMTREIADKITSIGWTV